MHCSMSQPERQGHQPHAQLVHSLDGVLGSFGPALIFSTAPLSASPCRLVNISHLSDWHQPTLEHRIKSTPDEGCTSCRDFRWDSGNEPATGIRSEKQTGNTVDERSTIMEPHCPHSSLHFLALPFVLISESRGVTGKGEGMITSFSFCHQWKSKYYLHCIRASTVIVITKS